MRFYEFGGAKSVMELFGEYIGFTFNLFLDIIQFRFDLRNNPSVIVSRKRRAKDGVKRHNKLSYFILYFLLHIFYKQGRDMTVVRLTRMGRKKKPFYRIVVTDSRKRRDGGWIEEIGYYNPMTQPAELKFDEERLAYWKSVGAKLSDRVARITK